MQVLTGATGSLGAHILEQLVSSTSVSKVICLSRAQSHAHSLTRVKESLRIRQRSLSPEKEKKIESLAANVNEDQLGLTQSEYAGLLCQSTAVIHVILWSLNRLSADVLFLPLERLAGKFCARHRLF